MNEIQAAIHAYFNRGALPPKDEPWEPPAAAGSTYWAPSGNRREKEMSADIEQVPKLLPGVWD